MANELEKYYSGYKGFLTAQRSYENILVDMGIEEGGDFDEEVRDWAFYKVSEILGDIREPNSWLKMFEKENLLILERSGAMDEYEESIRAFGVPTNYLEQTQEIYILFFVAYAYANYAAYGVKK